MDVQTQQPQGILQTVRHNKALMLAFCVLCCGLSITFWLSTTIEREQALATEQQLLSSAKAIAADTSKRLELYQYGLRGLRGHILTAGNALSFKSIRNYSQSRDVDIEFSGAHGFGFIRRVLDRDLPQFQANFLEINQFPIEIQQLNPHHEEHFVIEYIEPLEKNRAAMGLDIGSEQNRREAAIQALEQGQPRLTAPITLVQATGKPSRGFLILMPVYSSWAVPASLEQRWQQCIGWSYAPLIIDEVLSPLSFSSEQLGLRLLDVTQGQSMEFYQRESNLPVQLRQQVTFDIFGRQWQLELLAYPQYLSQLHPVNHHQYQLLGIGLSLLAALLVMTSFSFWKSRAEAFNRRTLLAAVVESAQDAIIAKDLTGKITSWNQGATDMFGFLPEEAIGKTVAELLIPPHLQSEEQVILQKLQNGERVKQFNTFRLTKTGQLREVLVNVTPVRNSQGTIIGASKIVRDVTELKLVEQHRNSLHQLLEGLFQATSGILILTSDAYGNIQMANQGAASMLGLPLSKLQQSSLSMFMHQEERSLWAGLLDKASAQAVVTERVQFQRLEGGSFSAMLTLTSIKNSDGNRNGYLLIATDLSEQMRDQRQIAEMRDQLAIAAQVAHLGVWTWDLQTDDLWWNEQMFSLYEYPKTLQQIGIKLNHWQQRVHPDDLPEVENQLKAAIAGEAEFETMFRIRTPKGDVRYLIAGAQFERTPEGKPLRMTGINLDITNRYLLDQQLRQALKDADHANQAKSHFVANISHEIRTPMNAVLGMLQLMSRTELAPKQQDYVQKAQQAASSLLALLNDILDFSKLEAGKFELEQGLLDLDDLCQELSVILAGNHKNPWVELLFDLPADITVQLSGDRLRLMQVLVNLCGNALKFTERGQVRLQIQLQQQGSQALVNFSVSDTGIGIEQEILPSLFDGFRQAEASTSRRFGGTGLGLAISARLVQLMGGKLEATSQPGIGSRFSFQLVLPILRSNPLKLRKSRPIYLCNSNPRVFELVSRWLSIWQMDYQELDWNSLHQGVMPAGPADLLLFCRAHEPSTEQLRQVQKYCDATGLKLWLVAAGSRQDLWQLNSNSLMLPITPGQIREIIQSQPRQKKAEEPQLPLRGVRILLVEDNSLNQQVAAELLQSVGADVTVANDGVRCLEYLAKQSMPDLILMDVQMPGMDGLEATRQLRALPGGRQVPVIAMTANVSRQDQQDCLLAGMDDYLAKPFNLPQLVQKIRHLVPQPQVSQRVALPPPLLEEFSELQARFGQQHSLLRHSAAQFGRDARSQLTLIQQAFVDKDMANLCKSLHQLRGMAGTLGALRLSEVLLRFEQLVRQGEPLTSRQIEEIEPLLDQTDLALQQQLQQLPEPVDATPIAVHQGDTQELLNHFRQLLQQQNLQALMMLPKLQGCINPAQYQQLDMHLQQLQFTAALNVVAKLEL